MSETTLAPALTVPALTSPDTYTDSLAAFVTASPSSYHAAAEVAARLEAVGLTQAARRPVSTYSLGMGQRLGLGLALGGDLVPRSLALRGRGPPTVRGVLALRSPVLGDLVLVLHDLLAHRPLLRRGLATQLGVPGAESAAVGPAAVGPAVRALALLGGGVEGGDVEQRGAHERVSEHGAEGLVVLPADVRGRPAGGGPGVDIVHEAALVGHAPSIPHARALCSAPPPAEDRPARVRRGGRDRFRSPARGGSASGMPRRTIDTPTP